MIRELHRMPALAISKMPVELRVYLLDIPGRTLPDLILHFGGTYCRYCVQRQERHADGKCLFMETSFAPMRQRQAYKYALKHWRLGA
jgi:hypothetical protein